jgi:hypothetical protein
MNVSYLAEIIKGHFVSGRGLPSLGVRRQASDKNTEFEKFIVVRAEPLLHSRLSMEFNTYMSIRP